MTIENKLLTQEERVKVLIENKFKVIQERK